jgi:hypothetical protein
MTTYELAPSDLIFYKEDGQIQAGGFSINSCLMNNRVPVVGGAKKSKAKNINIESSEKVSEHFDVLAVPAGLLYIHESAVPFSKETLPSIEFCEKDEVISDSMFDKLVELAEVKNAHRKFTRSKKGKSSKHKKTKRV